MIEDEQIRDLYYNESDAIENATQIVIDGKQTVAIWVAEEVEGVPVDALEWSISRVV